MVVVPWMLFFQLCVWQQLIIAHTESSPGAKFTLQEERGELPIANYFS